MIEKLATDFKNDILFKFLLGDDQDEDSVYLLKLIIENTLHIKCQSVQVLNPELVPEHIGDKTKILDVKVVTDTGDIVNIEMQSSSFTKNLYYRFQFYGANNLAKQKKRGEVNYINGVHHICQIIIIDDIDSRNMELVDTYESRNKRGIKEKYNLITRSYLQLPYIDVIVKEKGIRNLNEFEQLVYVFKNGLDDAIMSLKDQKVIEIMKKKLEIFNEDEVLRDMYYQRDLNRMVIEADKRDAREEGKAEGFNKGIEQGRQEGKYEEKISIIQAKYGEADREWLNSLSEKQLAKINSIIFEEDNYELFKQKVEEPE